MFEYLTVTVEKASAGVIFLGDPHWGGENQDRKGLRRTLKYAEKNNFYVVSMGDNLDQSFAQNYGVIGKTMDPQEAAYEMANDLRPLVEKGLFLGACQGNHDQRIMRATRSNFDFTEALLNEWNEIYKQKMIYGKPTLLLRFRVKRNDGDYDTFIILCHHGKGGGATSGAALNWASKMRNLCFDCDAYIMGHHHKPSTADREVQMYNRSQGIIRKRQTFISVGGHQEGGDFPEENMMESAPCLDAMLTLEGRGKGKDNKRMRHSWVQDVC